MTLAIAAGKALATVLCLSVLVGYLILEWRSRNGQ